MKVEQKPTAYKRAFYESDLKKMADRRGLSEHVIRHMNHKPYQCDFGGGKNDKKDEV